MKIIVKHFALGDNSVPYVIDSQGRLWVYNNGHWSQLAELPEDPTPDADVIRTIE